jgi:transcription elongation factor SPT5
MNKVGAESKCVLRLYQRCTQGMYAHMIPPRSIYAPIGIIGRVFVEAKRLADVHTICRGMSGVRWWESRKIDNLEAMRLLQRQMPPFQPEENGWVHIKKRPYTRDIAVIRQVLPKGRLEVIVVPRIPPSLKRTSQNQGSEVRKHTKPLAQLVDLKAFAKSGRRLRIEGTGTSTIYRYRRRAFDSSGYLLLTLTPDEYYHINVFPTVAQIRPFANSISISSSAKLKAFRCAESRQLQIGDKVAIIASEHAGRVGEIDAVLDTYVYVHFSDRSGSDLPETIQIPVSFVRRHFKIGDNVRVKTGESTGYTGYIVNLDDQLDQMIICNSSAVVCHCILNDCHWLKIGSASDYSLYSCRV